MEQRLMRDAQRVVARRPAWLVARSGVLWVTRSGELEDHVLRRGQRMSVARGDDVVVQSWYLELPAAWGWEPIAAAAPQGLRRALPAWAWARVAAVLRGAAKGLAALARSAAAKASRAQGCISCGDSIASAGTVQ